jgi:hypothetical protein
VALADLLKKLVPVKKGDDVRRVASHERINALQDSIRAIARGENVVSGENIRKKLGENFFILSAQRQRPGGGGVSETVAETPFEVVSRINPDTGALELGVISNSHLFNSEDRDTYEEDNSDWGLLDDDQTIGWFDPGSIGDKIWLKIELDPADQGIISIDVMHGSVGGGWPQYPDPIEINIDDPGNPYQQFFYQIIAEITDPEQDPRGGLILTIPGSDPPQQIQVTQLLFANLMMTTARTTDDADEPGLALLVAVLWNVLPGTATDGSADEIPSEDDMMTPWQLGTAEEENHYAFELINASDTEGAKVLIYDGQIFGPNDLGSIDPAGMPSDDSYILAVQDQDEIWLGINWDIAGAIINNAWIDHGPATPDNEGDNVYVTIGYADVDTSGAIPIVYPTNALCGDLIFQLPIEPETDNFVLMAKDGKLVWAEVCDATCGAS